jgi:hypothetical protein
MSMKTAILGWGSLLWDTRPEFDLHHGRWEQGGPMLPIEFSRVSETRGGVLTLVIDHQFGAECATAFSISTRKNPDDVICDLRCREGTTVANIGRYFADGSRQHTCAVETLVAIKAWAHTMNINVVVWTDLASNFARKSLVKKPFSVLNALAHLQLLPPEAKANAAEYIWRAPTLVDTPLRRAVETEPWFQDGS